MIESVNTMLVERASETDTQDEPTFSAGSMFGMLLVLSLCLLAQPQGNLIFKKPSNVFGRVLFFFLRLNPFACVVEAVSILLALVLIFQRAMGSYQCNRYRGLDAFFANIQAGAAALLFLRSHTALLPWYTDPRLDEKLVGLAPEGGHVAIDIIALLTVVGAIIKLIASAIPWYFRVISWCYIGGWMAVQLAVMLSHCGPSKDQLDAKTSLLSAEHLQRRVTDLESAPLWVMMIIIQVTTLNLYFFDDIDKLYFLSLVILVAPAGLLLGAMKLIMLQKSREALMTFALLVTLLVTIATITVCLVWYEEEGTLKPGWLDWLG